MPRAAGASAQTHEPHGRELGGIVWERRQKGAIVAVAPVAQDPQGVEAAEHDEFLALFFVPGECEDFPYALALSVLDKAAGIDDERTGIIRGIRIADAL